jgi:branched-chain amino acid transport system substrate-binding protein
MRDLALFVRRRQVLTGIGGLALAAAAWPALAAEATPGVTATEIKIGQTMPYSGPISAYATVGRAELAYFRMLNEHGGVNGRKITLISVDDGFVPAKTVEQTRKLVESDGVAFLFNSIGTATNSAIEKYLNDRKIPQLFVGTFASKFNDPQHFPWTMGALGNYRVEGQVYGVYVREQRPNAKVGVLYQNDDYGRDYSRVSCWARCKRCIDDRQRGEL